jgi:hypothetical protein
VARPKQKTRRDRQFNVSLTAHELDLLRARAARFGMRPVDYGRWQLFSDRPTRAAQPAGRPHLDPLFLNQLSRLGNNLNQAVRMLNALRHPAPPTLEPLLQEIRALVARGAADGP